MRKPERPAIRRHVTIKDIAQVLGVSHATVSRALNDSALISAATRTRVQAAAREMGYIPDTAARVIRGEASNLVGFILPDVQNHFYSAIAKVLAETVSAEGLQLVLAISEDNPGIELRHVEELRRARARGIIITPVAGMLPETSALLSDMQVVQLVRSHPLVRADVVAAQDMLATGLATRHLIGLGHRAIAYLGGGQETLSTGTHRLDGYLGAMREAGLEPPAVRRVPPHPGTGYRAALELLRLSDRPTALVITSSQLTLGVLRAIRELGLTVAEDISIVSYDDPDWYAFWGPGLSTIALPIREMAHFAAHRVCFPTASVPPAEGLEIGDLPTGQSFSFPVRLLERGSCRPI